MNAREQNWVDAGRLLRGTVNILGRESMWDVVLVNTNYCVDRLSDGEEYMRAVTVYMRWREWVPRGSGLFDDYCINEA